MKSKLKKLLLEEPYDFEIFDCVYATGEYCFPDTDCKECEIFITHQSLKRINALNCEFRALAN
jgi:hypothetical protein